MESEKPFRYIFSNYNIRNPATVSGLNDIFSPQTIEVSTHHAKINEMS